jgi:hypothetical protein
MDEVAHRTTFGMEDNANEIACSSLNGKFKKRKVRRFMQSKFTEQGYP